MVAQKHEHIRRMNEKRSLIPRELRTPSYKLKTKLDTSEKSVPDTRFAIHIYIYILMVQQLLKSLRHMAGDIIHDKPS